MNRVKSHSACGCNHPMAFELRASNAQNRTRRIAHDRVQPGPDPADDPLIMAPAYDQQIGFPVDDFLADSIGDSGVYDDVWHVEIQALLQAAHMGMSRIDQILPVGGKVD